MGRRRPRFTLSDLQVDEVSFVSAGDNEGAHITMFKRDPEADEGGLPAHVVDELIKAEADREDEPGKGLMNTTVLTKSSDVLAEVFNRAEELRKADPTLTPTQARIEVWMENVDLREAYAQAAAERDAAIVAASATGTAKAESVVKGGDVLKKHAGAAAELRKADPSLTVAEARTLAWRQDPDLYEEYRRAIDG